MSAFTPDRLLPRLAAFGAAPRCWIAFSGGLDSSVLLDAAAEVRDRLPGQLLAVHVDHGLQAGSSAWAAHCAARCEALSIPIHVERLTTSPAPGESREAWAREARHAVFRRLLGPGEILLTAQHRDDQAETLMLALLRGSGPHGLAAMPTSAPLGAGWLVRPLLDFSRQSLLAHARGRGLDWIHDPSNDHTALDRNYLRHRVLPLLRERWPAVDATLSRSASHCAEAAELVDRLAARTLSESRGLQGAGLSIQALTRLDRSLCKAVLRLWLKERGFISPDAHRLARLLDELPRARADANPLVAWDGCEVRRYRGEMFALAPLPCPPPTGLRLDWRLGPGVSVLTLPLGLGRLEWRPAAGGDGSAGAAGMSTDLQVRFGQRALSCRAAVASARRSLKGLFQERGVPAWLRPYIPLVFQGDTDSLLAIAGVAACHDRSDMMGVGFDLSWSGFPWERDWPTLGRALNVRLPGAAEGQGPP